MPPIYRIHPAIGVARLGNSPDAFYLAPESAATLPTECDAEGNPVLSPDGKTEQPVKAFKDEQGRVKRQAARFQIYVYDDEHPEGRPLRRGDRVEGGGNQGRLVDVQWRVWIANKKASWYQFQQLEGEHGYAPDHPLRNPGITDPNARQRLVIDPGPRVVDGTTRRTATFGRDGGDQYAATFPPPLQPESIDTLGELKTDDQGRLLVLGGHGHSGSWKYEDFGQPRIDDYANNDGWFDDTSDGPVMARLVMFMDEVQQTRYVDVEYPAWVLCGYPRYVPQTLDLITLDDAIEDMSIRQLAARTDLYGQSGTFSHPQKVDVHDPGALAHWRAGRLQWNPDYRPWFFRDIWSILFRPDQFTYLSDILQASNAPHNQSTRGTFNPDWLGQPPEVNWKAVRRCEADAARRLESGALFVESLAPVLDLLEKEAGMELRGALAEAGGGGGEGERLLGDLAGVLTEDASAALQSAVASYVAVLGRATTGGGERVRGTPDGGDRHHRTRGAGGGREPGGGRGRRRRAAGLPPRYPRGRRPSGAGGGEGRAGRRGGEDRRRAALAPPRAAAEAPRELRARAHAHVAGRGQRVRRRGGRGGGVRAAGRAAARRAAGPSPQAAQRPPAGRRAPPLHRSQHLRSVSPVPAVPVRPPPPAGRGEPLLRGRRPGPAHAQPAAHAAAGGRQPHLQHPVVQVPAAHRLPVLPAAAVGRGTVLQREARGVGAPRPVVAVLVGAAAHRARAGPRRPLQRAGRRLLPGGRATPPCTGSRTGSRPTRGSTSSRKPPRRPTARAARAWSASTSRSWATRCRWATTSTGGCSRAT